MARRLLSTALVLLLAASLAGCWVINEIDKGSKYMDDHSATSKKTKDAEQEKSAAPVGKKHAIDDYFKSEEADGTTQTFSPGTVSEAIVSCKLGGSVQFMKREDCAARGGRAN